MRRTVGTSNRGNMRHGLISLLTVVVVISLATAAVLSVSTSHAMAALSTRQANMTAESYDAERAAQTMLALVDDELQAAKAKGITDAPSLATRIEDVASTLLAKACPEGVTATHEVDDTTFTCTFVTTNGRMLTTRIDIEDGATYVIASWKLTAAPQVIDNGDTLWSGPTGDN